MYVQQGCSIFGDIIKKHLLSSQLCSQSFADAKIFNLFFYFSITNNIPSAVQLRNEKGFQLIRKSTTRG